jgi:hypothetical protein
MVCRGPSRAAPERCAVLASMRKNLQARGWAARNLEPSALPKSRQVSRMACQSRLKSVSAWLVLHSTDTASMPILRRLARPLSALVAVAFLVPVRPADCAGFAASSHERMPCCARQLDAATALDAGCCNVRESTPLPDRAPTSTPAGRRTSAADDAPAAQIACTMPAPSNLSRGSAAADPDPPTFPLYLRISVLRR